MTDNEYDFQDQLRQDEELDEKERTAALAEFNDLDMVWMA